MAMHRDLTRRRRTTLAAALAVAAVLGVLSAAVAHPGPLPAPPAGLLSINGGAPIEGEPGSYCIDEGCGDIAVRWLIPETASPASAEAALTFSVDGHKISSWQASAIRTKEAPSGDVGTVIGGENGLNADSVTFTGPPAGDWVVSVFAIFGDCCDAVYYFRLGVDLPDTAVEMPQPTPADLWPALLVAAAAAGALLGWHSRRLRRTPSRG